MAKILSLCLAVANTTAAYDRAIYILGTGRDSQSLNDGVVHEDAAKLILQQQMISAEQATLGYAEEAVVEMLNDFGGEQERLFNDESNKDVRQKLLVVFQGMDIETSEYHTERGSPIARSSQIVLNQCVPLRMVMKIISKFLKAQPPFSTVISYEA